MSLSTSRGRQPAGRKEVVCIVDKDVAALALGVAMFVIALVKLVIELIKLGRR